MRYGRLERLSHPGAEHGQVSRDPRRGRASGLGAAGVGRQGGGPPPHSRLILLLADDGTGATRTDEDIAAASGCGLRTIARVRKRFVTESVEAAVSPRPPPPRPDKVRIRGSVERRLVELACGVACGARLRGERLAMATRWRIGGVASAPTATPAAEHNRLIHEL